MVVVVVIVVVVVVVIAIGFVVVGISNVDHQDQPATTN